MDILYRDKRILVAIKPAGTLSTDEPGGMPEKIRQETGIPCVKTVHRLDAAVSGVMVFALSRMAASLLGRQVQEHTFEKEYLAILHGVPEQPEGELIDLLGRDKIRRITYIAGTTGKDVQEARLSYWVLATANNLSLVRIRLHTGRTHQIRVQFASRGFPLVGDRKYGIATDNCPIALFSCHLGFTHPETGERMDFSAQPPHVWPWEMFGLI